MEKAVFHDLKILVIMLFVMLKGFVPYDRLDSINALVLKGHNMRLSDVQTNEGASFMIFYKKVLMGEWDRDMMPTDTLIIGDTPAETLRITGIWSHDGPIFVMNDGVLIVDNAYITINGNLYILNSGKVLIDSSYVLYPQVYFYQYGIIVAQNGEYVIQNSTTDFGGFTFGTAVMDSARYIERSVINRNFTTLVALGDNPYIEISNTDNVGEIVVSQRGRYIIKNSDTILVWFRMPRGCTVSVSLPYADTVWHFSFDSTLSGVSGIEYSVIIDTTTSVMWGMIVEDSSYVMLTNSYIRSIGLLFMGRDTVNVSGIVGDNTYSSYTLPVSDRYIYLDNTYVRTFSLYPTDTSVVYVRGSILGEILTMGNSYAEITSSYVDGSGGYLGSSENSVSLSAFVSITANIKSFDNSILFFIYSSQAGLFGQNVASGKSILVIGQSSLLDYPTVYDSAFAWVSNIKSPATAPINSLVDIEGDAYGESGPLGSFLRFVHYSLRYQKLGDSTWYPIIEGVSTPAKDGVLATWNTTGLEPGAYLLSLTTKVSTGDSITVLKVINLTAVNVQEKLVKLKEGETIYDVAGRSISHILKPGIYFIKRGKEFKKVIIRW